MQISIKKDLTQEPFSKMPSGTVFRFPKDKETFYIKARYKCEYQDGPHIGTISGGVNLYDGRFLLVGSEEEVIPYYDAEVTIQ